jgi:pathogenesis-related protein 1
MHMAATTRALALAMAVVAMAATTTMAQNSPEDYVALHNAARAEVGVGQVWWDATLQGYAEWYADQRRGDCAGQHSQGSGYGENLYWGPGGWPWSGVDAVNLWVAEREFYDYNSNTCSGPYGCGHYTQVVWRDTTYIGCARVECDNNLGVFITCNYWPPGNWEGQWPYLAARSGSAA